MTFQLLPIRLTFRARGPLFFPAYKSGNILRGTFGSILKQLSCPPECQSARNCPLDRDCLYARIFETRADSPSPSGLTDTPRPFVFRAYHLDNRHIVPGELFYFDLHLFDVRNTCLPQIVLAFSRLAEMGLNHEKSTPNLGRAILENVTGTDGQHLYGNQRFSSTDIQFKLLSLLPIDREIQRLRVRFLTPTELKLGSAIATKPEFGTLFARARDRVSTLSRIYGEGALEIDYRATGERADCIVMTACTLHHVKANRTSGSTGQTHSLGGFVGEAEYEGDLREFLPYLYAAAWTGVGRQTTWGKGAIEVVEV